MGKIPLYDPTHGVRCVEKRVLWTEHFRGETLVFDASIVMHQILHNVDVARQVLAGNHDAYWLHLLAKIKMLWEYEINPLFVFDGLDQPAKASEREARETKRAEAQQRLEEDDSDVNVKAAISVTEELVTVTIKQLIQLGVQYMVAPYQVRGCA